MAETVVSMARSMLGGAISMAASAAATEMSLLIGVRKDIWFIKDELKTMQAFLVAAEKTKKKNMLLEVWAEQVRDLAYGIEDCLDEFMVHVGSQSRSRRLLKLNDRHRIASQIRDLKARVEEVSNRNARYNLINADASSNIDEVNASMEDVRSHSAGNIDEAELVGFVKPKEELIKMVDVNSRDGLSKVICVVGMGGLGKTTLAGKAYASKEDIVNKFACCAWVYASKEDIVNKFACCAWVTVSQSFSKIEMLKEMISQLLGTESLRKCLKELEQKAVQVEHLANYLREKLEDKRYFIVLDDLWTIDAWNWIKYIAFPIRNNKGSRIIVTTRDVGLAAQCTSESLIYHLKHLQIEDATNLLLRKSGKTREDMKNDKKMMAVVNKIVKKCGGLPLAILTIGGMLGNKKATEWESIYTQIPSELESNPSLEAMRRIVTLSYNNLPSHLKSCFLYLSIFPEDFEIKRRRLVDRWITEGFVRARGGVNIEDVGISYFTELINRSMIQPSKVSIEGHVKSCRVHDIMHDVMVSISREENFVYLAGDNATTVSEGNFRHVAYNGSKCQKLGMDCSHVRSLTMFGERSLDPSPSVCSSDMRMLRALDLENAQFQVTQKDISNIGLLRHLKYVNFSDPQGYSHIYKLPRSIGKLQGLRTLDIRGSYITKLPTEICKLKSLHSLRFTTNGSYEYFDLDDPKNCLLATSCLPIFFTPLFDPSDRAEVIAELHMAWCSHWSESDGVRVPKGISKLKELQVLEVVDINRTSGKAIKELGELVQLRKLSVVTQGATKQKCEVLCDAIQKLTCLRSLEVHGSLEWMHVVSSPPPLLRSLKLEGCLGEVPGWFGNLMYLVKLHLWSSEIKEEGKIMEILGPLPNLMHLRLEKGSYIGKKLGFKTEAFPNLKKLDILYLEQVRELIFEEGTSPQLGKIEITFCWLESGINSIDNLASLKEIWLNWYAQVARLGVLQRELDAHPNNPVLRLQKERSYHDLDEGTEGEESSYLHPEHAATGEASSSQVAIVTTGSHSRQDPDIREVQGSTLVEDDFWSCNSDDDDA
ncbi:disease resistance protein RPM1-like isoform X1 [Triticum urartu]|uniref:Disease resistance protein RPM1 n=1 Tax=Triticum urartu TaxID=4572 RepID=A0A8R7UZM6_TRIUA|nr:disease resistance protein RPM1-like isoform X1 [Triticum urartu]XP_048543207.1 disease resistance protein RPM1-like isoform X1 [Triticum urartu]XP_048543208.1 disease resistance protein RPM1-like isoform X1 [Triticum urartu]XP_048543209.1 disease resistance protein RPM1-like isoform X1 [Triticum urartu]XP_048543210.1 disease resistance protein RPM1-like isoform X1 [Triticum urartu]XP_048543211.1 disease resistance protein RPM1-like isoform X1 [Triticum urartu]XP_048543212.1 disease resist